MTVTAYLLKFSGIAAVLLVWIVFRFWKSSSPSAPPPFFTNQHWTLGDAVVCLILVDVSMILGGDLFDVTPAVWSLKLGVQLVIHAMPFLVLWGFCIYYLRQPLSTMGLSGQRMGSLSISGILWGLGLCGGFAFVLAWTPETLTGELIKRFSGINLYPVIEIYGPLGLGIYYLFQTSWLVGFAALTEELTYRGLFYGALRRHITFVPAMIITSLCFMVSHLGFNPLIFAFGCLMAYLVEKYQSLIPAIVTHFFWDFTMRLHQFFIGGLHVEPTGYFRTTAVVSACGLGLTYAAAQIMKRRQASS